MTDPDALKAHCRTCMFWRAGHPPIATTIRIPDPHPDLGICEYHPPTVHVVAGAAVSLFPAVHAERCCLKWMPDEPFDDPDGPGGGEAAKGDNIVQLRDAA